MTYLQFYGSERKTGLFTVTIPTNPPNLFPEGNFKVQVLVNINFNVVSDYNLSGNVRFVTFKNKIPNCFISGKFTKLQRREGKNGDTDCAKSKPYSYFNLNEITFHVLKKRFEVFFFRREFGSEFAFHPVCYNVFKLKPFLQMNSQWEFSGLRVLGLYLECSIFGLSALTMGNLLLSFAY